MTAKSFSQYITQLGSGFRLGVVLRPQVAPSTFADMSGFVNAGVATDPAFAGTASGCMHTDEEMALGGAIGEALERYSAGTVPLTVKTFSEHTHEKIVARDEWSLFSDEQYAEKDFPFPFVSKEEDSYAAVFDLMTNERAWVPEELVGLGARTARAHAPSTSTGLAAHTTFPAALLSALSEALERDALASYWMHSLPGRALPISPKYAEAVEEKGGEVYVFDITQVWNPWPVVLIIGQLPQRGKKRYSMGVACRTSLGAAIDKAYAEWLQGVYFAGFNDVENPELEIEGHKDVTSFELHAVYYTRYPERFAELPILKGDLKSTRELSSVASSDPFEQISKALPLFKKAGIQLFYRDITVNELHELGMHTVRVLSPDFALLHADERYPFLGGRMSDVKWRYPDLLKYSNFPNQHPHPLG